MATSALAVEVPLPVGSSDAAAAELLAVRADAQPAMASIATGRAAPAVAGPDAPMSGGGCSASAPGDVVRHTPVHAAATTFEPLKVCLDDDSSIEDSDEDMFDDDAFTFGDDDFLALNEAMKRAAMMKSLPHCNDYQSAATTSSAPAGPAQNSYLPLHQHSPASSPISEKAPISTDSSPSTSQASLATLTLTSHLSFTSMSKKTKSKRRVSLHNDVAVIPIPHRTEYSSLVRERIWSSASELYQNAARNAIEFAAEGFDWRNVADDEQMVQSPSGERIHPIHLLNISGLGPEDQEPSCQSKGGAESPVGMDTEPLPS